MSGLVVSLALWTSPVCAAELPTLVGNPLKAGPTMLSDAAVVVSDPRGTAAAVDRTVVVETLSETRGIPDSRISVVEASLAGRAVTARVQRAATTVEPGGWFWVFLSVPPESPNALRDLADAAATHRGSATVLIIDADHRGAQAGALDLPGKTFLWASSAQAPLGAGTSPFTYSWAGAMRGWADENRDGLVTMAEVETYLAGAMRSGGLGTPMLRGAGSEDLVASLGALETGPRARDVGAALRASPSSTGRVPARTPTAGLDSSEVEVNLGGKALDFEALAAEARAADAAIEAARIREARSAAERAEDIRHQLHEAKVEVRLAARRDFETISDLVEAPTDSGRKVLELWLERYGEATVRVGDASEPVDIPEVAAVRRALGEAGETATPSQTGAYRSSADLDLQSVLWASFERRQPAEEKASEVEKLEARMASYRYLAERRGQADPEIALQIAETAYELLELTGESKYLGVAKSWYGKVYASKSDHSVYAIRARYMEICLMFIREGADSRDVYSRVIEFMRAYGINGRYSEYRSSVYVILGEIFFIKGDRDRAFQALDLAKDNDLNPVFRAFRNLRLAEIDYGRALAGGDGGATAWARAKSASKRALEAAQGRSLLRGVQEGAERMLSRNPLPGR